MQPQDIKFLCLLFFTDDKFLWQIALGEIVMEVMGKSIIVRGLMRFTWVRRVCSQRKAALMCP